MKSWLLAIFLTLVAACQPLVNTLPETIEQSRQATVRIYGPGFSCSGFHLGDGIFITAAHCTEGQPFLWIQDVDLTIQMIAVPIKRDGKTDVAVIRALKSVELPKLRLQPKGKPPLIGGELVAIGYPAYYGLEMMFEAGQVKDRVILNDVKLIISKEAAYMGHSGGPVIDVETGLVIGLSSSMLEMVKPLPSTTNKNLHQHVSLSHIVSSEEIHIILDSIEG